MDIEEQYDKIFRFCFWKIHNRKFAEDLTQETFLRYLSSSHYDQRPEVVTSLGLSSVTEDKQ